MKKQIFLALYFLIVLGSSRTTDAQPLPIIRTISGTALGLGSCILARDAYKEYQKGRCRYLAYVFPDQSFAGLTTLGESTVGCILMGVPALILLTSAKNAVTSVKVIRSSINLLKRIW